MQTKKQKIDKPTKAYSSLKFKDEQVTIFKPGKDMHLEETNRVWNDEKGKPHKVFRIRRSTRNYYTSEFHMKQPVVKAS